MTRAESVNEALCHGWTDGMRRRLADQRYPVRFTPRKATSIWSAVKLRNVAELIAAGRMQPTSVRAYEARSAERSVIQAYEQAPARFDAASRKRFKAHQSVWTVNQTSSFTVRTDHSRRNIPAVWKAIGPSAKSIRRRGP